MSISSCTVPAPTWPVVTWTGGVAQYVGQYPSGTTGFVARCKELADACGDRSTRRSR